MSDLNIDPKQISESLKETLGNWSDEVKDDLVGYVASIADGVARVKGLENAMSSELLEFPGGLLGVALNLDEDSIGVVLMGDSDHIQEGMPVKQTGEVLSIGVGDGFLGRVIDTLGNPIDGKGPIEFTERRLMETQAPTVVERQPVGEPLQTGIKAIDSMIPIGRGQRELIIGDRQTGKSAIATDTIINQKSTHNGDSPVYCVYVAIGQKASTVAKLVGELEANGAMEYTTVVVANASDPAPLQYIAPYSGCAIGEYYRDNGMHGLIVYDDLSKQATAYRQMSLVLRRPPGREAFPGDVFYLHSRLLERSSKLSEDLGSGSLTALPVIETQEGDVSAYIPTNVISITDGQIYLDTNLFNGGVRPAVDVGLSVSRVGGNAQIKAMKKIAGKLRLDLAQFRELEAFAKFASDLDEATAAQITRGRRMVEILKQNQYVPMSTANQVIIIYAASQGYLDDIELESVKEFEVGLLEHFASKAPECIKEIDDTGNIGDDLADKMNKTIEEFKKSF